MDASKIRGNNTPRTEAELDAADAYLKAMGCYDLLYGFILAQERGARGKLYVALDVLWHWARKGLSTIPPDTGATVAEGPAIEQNPTETGDAYNAQAMTREICRTEGCGAKAVDCIEEFTDTDGKIIHEYCRDCERDRHNLGFK